MHMKGILWCLLVLVCTVSSSVSEFAEKVRDCWTREALPLFVTSSRTSLVDEQLIDAFQALGFTPLILDPSAESRVRKKWFKLSAALEEDLSAVRGDKPKFRTLSVLLSEVPHEGFLLFRAIPENPARTSLLLKALKLGRVRAVFSVTTREVHKLVDTAIQKHFDEILIIQPGLSSFASLEASQDRADAIPHSLIVSADDLADSVHKYSLQFPDLSLPELLDLWRSRQLKLDLGLLDTLHAVLLPGVDHPDLRHSASSKFARISMADGESFLRLRQSRDRYGRVGWSEDGGVSDLMFRLPTQFPRTFDNPLMYMTLMREGLRYGDIPVTTLEAFSLVETQGVLKTANANALTNDGNLLEAMAAVAFVAASHRGSLTGSRISDFTLRLVQELLPEPEPALMWRTGEGEFSAISSSLGSLVMPFLSPVNSRWPPVEGLNMANLIRPSTALMVDLIVEDQGIYAEVKNYKDALDSQTVLSIVARLKKDAKILFIVTNRLRELGGLADWRTKLQIPASIAEIESLVARLHLSTPKRKKSFQFKKMTPAPPQPPAIVPRTFHDVNLVVVKRRANSLSLQPLPGSDPVPDCRSLVVIIPIRDLAAGGYPQSPN